MKFVFKADAGQWVKATNAYESIMAKALTLGMRDTGKEAEKAGRDAIAAAGFSETFQSSFRAVNKPKSGYVLNPSVYLHTTINYADVFEKGATISGKPFLWLPLPNVPSIQGRLHMTPAQYVRNVGPLVTMRRPNGMPMLGARIAITATESITRRALARGLLGRGRASTIRGRTQVVPLFVGIPAVNIPKKFDVLGAVEKAVDGLPANYNEHVKVFELQYEAEDKAS